MSADVASAPAPAAAVRPRARARRAGALRRALSSCACVLIGITYLIPLLWVVSLSLRSESDATSLGIVPSTFRPSNYPDAFKHFGMGSLFANSALVTAGTVALALAMSVLAAYGFARWRSRITESMFLLILLGLMVPPATMVVPFFLAMLNMGLYNSLLAVILGEAAFALPLGILILRGYIDRIPHELTDAARVDGAGPLRSFVHVVLPLLKAPIVTVALFIAMFTWNDFLLPLVLLPDPSHSTITVGLAQSVGQFGQLQLALISAASVMALLPILAIFIAARRYYVQGLNAGALKQ